MRAALDEFRPLFGEAEASSAVLRLDNESRLVLTVVVVVVVAGAMDGALKREPQASRSIVRIWLPARKIVFFLVFF